MYLPAAKYIPGLGTIFRVQTNEIADGAITAAKLANDGDGEVFNVVAYGAKNDGSDSTVAIQAAWSAWTALGRGRLYFPPGRYTISSGLVFTPTSHVRGPMVLDGYGASLTYTGNAYAIDWNNQNGFEVRDFLFRGITIKGQSELALIRIKNKETGDPQGHTYRFRIEDVMLNDVAGHGLEIDGAVFEFSLSNVMVWARSTNTTNYGMYFHQTPGNGKLSSVDIYNPNVRGFKHGIYGTPSLDIDIFGGTVLQAQEYGIRLSIQGNTLQGVHVEDNWRSVASQADGDAGVYLIGWGTLTGVRAYPLHRQKYGVRLYADQRSFVINGQGAFGASAEDAYWIAVSGNNTGKIVFVGVDEEDVLIVSNTPTIRFL